VSGCFADNLALNKAASQTTTDAMHVASLAVDCRQDTWSCTLDDVHPWLAVDLGEEYSVSHVTVTNEATPILGKRPGVCFILLVVQVE